MEGSRVSIYTNGEGEKREREKEREIDRERESEREREREGVRGRKTDRKIDIQVIRNVFNSFRVEINSESYDTLQTYIVNCLDQTLSLKFFFLKLY